jgi:rare lipoprotein A
VSFKFLPLALALSASAPLASTQAQARHAVGGGGLASWYGPGLRGHRTANGERFDGGAYTAAHRTLPFGTRLRVTCRRTGRSVVVRVNDRGPFVGGRVIDLSQAASRALGMTGTEAVTLARL